MKNGREPGDLTGGEQLGPLQMLLFGALSGASAEAVVYPMEVIRRRMQVQAASASTAGQSCHSLVLMPGAWQLHVRKSMSLNSVGDLPASLVCVVSLHRALWCVHSCIA